MKICNKCHKEKNDTPGDNCDFHWKNQKLNLLHNYCKQCHKGVRRSHYNKEESIAYCNQRKKERQIFVNSLKDKPCLDCGREFKPHQMDFDHKSDKIRDITKMIARKYSFESIRKEILKCDLVCACCHRDRTFNRSLANRNESRT
jgi:hypothetical protein